MHIAMFTDFSILAICFRLLLATACGGVIGAERLMSGRAAGIRTHMVVCVGSTLTAMIGVYCANYLMMSTDPLRISAQVISGIGFLGVGTILIRGRNEVTGLTTAAGLWTTAAIGIAIGYSLYFMAIAVTLVTFLVIWIMTHVETILGEHRHQFDMYLELEDVSFVNEVVERLNKDFTVDELDVTAPRSAVSGNVGMEIVISEKQGKESKEVLSHVKAYEHVVYVLASV